MNQLTNPLTPQTKSFNKLLKSLFEGEHKLVGIKVIQIASSLKCDYCEENCTTTKRVDKISMQLLQYHSRGGVISRLCDECSEKINDSYKMKITYIDTCFFCETRGKVKPYLMDAGTLHSYVDVCSACIGKIKATVEEI